MSFLGTYLTPIIACRRKISFRHLSAKKVAFDANNVIYQFLALIRQPNGQHFTDSTGRVTSHLMGVFYRITRLAEYGILPVFVFDGEPHPLKLKEIEKRREIKEKAEREWIEALFRGDLATAWRKAIQTSRLTREMTQEVKELLELMGLPWVQAPSDAEAQAAYMVVKGDVYCTCSRDWDSLLYGSPRLVRYLTISGTELLPSKGIMRPLEPEIIKLDVLLDDLKITREQLVDIAILVGTDFNEGVKGVGPKKALKLIKTYGSIENILKSSKIHLEEDYKEIRKIFLKPKVTNNYKLEWRLPDKEGIIKFLCEKRSFKRERVENAIRRLEKLMSYIAQRKLSEWFYRK